MRNTQPLLFKVLVLAGLSLGGVAAGCSSSSSPGGGGGGASCSSLCASAPSSCSSGCNAQCSQLQTQCANAGQSSAFDNFASCGPTFTCNGAASQLTNCQSQAASLVTTCLRTNLDASPPHLDGSPGFDVTQPDGNVGPDGSIGPDGTGFDGGTACATLCASVPAACNQDCATQCALLQTECANAGKSAAFDAFVSCGPMFTCNGSQSQVTNCQSQAVALVACLDAGTIDAGTPDAGMVCDPTTMACCDARAPFTPIPWAAPTPFTVSCSGTQLAAYAGTSGCLTTGNGDCSAFRADSANAACVACLETDVNAATHGPIVTVTSGGVVGIVEVNWGGCEAVKDGDPSATGCGAKFDNLNDCILNDCAGCSDFASNGPVSSACIMSAFTTGTCTNDRITQACDNELFVDGGVATAACGGQLVTMLTAWCGGG